MKDLPKLSPNPPTFVPTGRYNQERKEIIDKMNPGFLLPIEHALLHHFMCLHQDGFAWNNSERGHFREGFFPPIEMPVIPHMPWVLRNIPIPPGIYNEVCVQLKKKIDAGMFEPLSTLYQSCWFCVVKKDGKSLRIVQSLEPLNAVTIQHSGVPPFRSEERRVGKECSS